jgi:hypothetical protein
LSLHRKRDHVATLTKEKDVVTSNVIANFIEKYPEIYE